LIRWLCHVSVFEANTKIRVLLLVESSGDFSTRHLKWLMSVNCGDVGLVKDFSELACL